MSLRKGVGGQCHRVGRPTAPEPSFRVQIHSIVAVVHPRMASERQTRSGHELVSCRARAAAARRACRVPDDLARESRSCPAISVTSSRIEISYPAPRLTGSGPS